MKRAALVGILAILGAGLPSCKSRSLDDSMASGGTGAVSAAGAAGAAGVEETGLVVDITPDARSYVKLDGPALVPESDPANLGWDLAFQGRDIFINGGISGIGNTSVFGPLSAPTYLSDTAPDVPLMLKDRAGGAFLDWYDYAGNLHELFSRYHVYGLIDGKHRYKLQVLSYYADLANAMSPAMYRVRYAEVATTGSLKTHDVMGIDATAGGSKDDDSQPSACLTLDTEQVTPLTPAAASAAPDWQLCFRRDEIAVNGGLSGPRGMQAVDLEAAATAGEMSAEVQTRTAASEQALFDGIDYAALTDPALDYRADGVVTAFGQRWLAPNSDPLAVDTSVWLVIAADGASKFLLRFSDLQGDPSAGAAKLRLEAKSVK
jgi:hypothetical protein